jgi:hypothetical protein
MTFKISNDIVVGAPTLMMKHFMLSSSHHAITMLCSMHLANGPSFTLVLLMLF